MWGLCIGSLSPKPHYMSLCTVITAREGGVYAMPAPTATPTPTNNLAITLTATIPTAPTYDNPSRKLSGYTTCCPMFGSIRFVSVHAYGACNPRSIDVTFGFFTTFY